MLFHISNYSDESLQQQIFAQIRAKILSGELEADQPLPSIRALSSELRVSVITVQRAYERLLNDQMIYARRSKGYFVIALDNNEKQSKAITLFKEGLTPLLDTARGDGLSDQEILDVFQDQLKNGGAHERS